MKNLKFLIIATILLFSSTAFAASNLWEFYNGELPTISERAEIYDRVDTYTGTAEQNVYLLGKLQGESGITLGGFRPSGYSGKLLTRLNEGGSETTFNTTPGTAPDGSSLTTAKIGDFVVLTINPGGANEEKISASAVSVSGTTATWTIINRGLSFTENAAVTANKNQHAIGETIIISNDDHYFKVQYAAIDEDVTVTGNWKVPTPSEGTSIANRDYVDGLTFGGIGMASETATGTVEIATGLETASSTTNGTLGRLVIPSSLATSTYNSATAGLKVVVTQNNGKIDPYFISTSTLLAPNITFSGSATAITGSTTIATCITCGNNMILVPGHQLASTSPALLGLTGVGNAYYSTATTTFFNMVDTNSTAFTASVQIPKAITQITGIKVLYSRLGTGNLKLSFASSYASTTYPTTPTTDSANQTIAGEGTDARIDDLTVPAGAFDSITSVLNGGMIHLFVGRDATDGGTDTYNADLLIYGVQFTFN